MTELTHPRLLTATLAVAVVVNCAAPLAPSRSTPARRPPTADEVLARYLAARGGLDRLRSLQVVERRGTMQVNLPSGVVSGPYRTCVVYGESGVVQVNAGPVQAAQLVVRGRALVCDQGFTRCDGAPAPIAADLLTTVEQANRELVYERQAWVAPPVVVEDRDQLRLDASRRDGTPVRYWFARDSGFLTKKQRGPESRTYADWRVHGGVAMPHRLDQFAAPGKRSWTVALEQIDLRGTPGKWCADLLARPVWTGEVPLVIWLTRGSEPEARTREQLRRLLGAHDLSPWTLTRSVQIDQEAIPHSHPVLTLHARHLAQDDLLLATYIHEQCHWHLERQRDAVDAAVTELKKSYPRVPVGGADGARSERSSYEHLIIGWLELDGVRQLLGPQRARAAIAYWTHDHYRWIYRTVLADADAIGRLVQRHGLGITSGARSRSGG